MKKTLILLTLFLSLVSVRETCAEGFEAGIGLGFANNTDGNGLFDGGWDFMFGYEKRVTDDLNLGMQLQVINGWTADSDIDNERAIGAQDSTLMAFNSQALFLTLHPDKWWLQFKAGAVHADYYSVHDDVNTYGTAIGVGLIIPSDIVQVHLLDYSRYIVGGKGFNIYSISIVIFASPLFL